MVSTCMQGEEADRPYGGAMVGTRMQGEEADRPYGGAMVSTRMQGAAADRPYGGRHSPRPRGSNPRSSEVIRGHPRSSEVVSGNQTHRGREGSLEGVELIAL